MSEMIPLELSAELGQRLAQSLRRRSDQICAATTSELPVPLSELVTEIEATARHLERHLGALGDRLLGRRPICAPDQRAALMLPGNILAGGVRTIADLVIGGNRVVARMTARAPATAAAVQSLFDEVVPGSVVIERTMSGPAFVEWLLTTPQVAFALVFGGEPLGDELLRRARAGAPKRIVFEGPGKDPIIVLDGADLDEVARVTAKAKLVAAGQRCVAPENVIVQRDLCRPLVDRLVAAFATARIGPVSSPKVPSTVRSQLDDAVRRGALIECGGTIDGQRIAPTIVTGATADMTVFQDETFAPVLAVASVDGPDDAVTLARSSRFGLACSVFGTGAEAVGEALRGEPYAEPVNDLVFGRYGHVAVNEGLRAATVRGPFGGYGKSGWIWDGGGLRQGPKSPALEATLDDATN